MKTKSTFTEQISSIIPGGCHTYSKGVDQFPSNAPPCIVYGQGARVWDEVGVEYIDCSMGLTSVSIGHGYEPVAKAVADAAYKGTNFQRPAYLELVAANFFLETVKSGDMVKFAKNGSTVTTAAVKLARAFTGRNKVAIAKEHNFFSYDDWFIGSTVVNSGIPTLANSLTVTFNYNNILSVQELLASKDHDIACLILEPVKFDLPSKNFLIDLQDLCRDKGVVLIFDEMVSGFKWAINGAQGYFGVKSDLSTWGKGMANGFSCCALTGRAEIMELGGIRNVGAEKLFLISSTHGAETIGLAAMMSTISEMKNHDMIASNWERGAFLLSELRKIISKNDLENYLSFIGPACLFAIVCKNWIGNIDDAMKTLLMQEMIEQNILFQGLFYTTWSHKNDELKKQIEAFDKACKIYKKALEAESTKGYLRGNIIKPVFRAKI